MTLRKDDPVPVDARPAGQVTALVAQKAQEAPEGFVRVDVRLLQEGGRYCFVKMANANGAEKIKAGDYALVNMVAPVSEGDMVLVGSDPDQLRIMRLRRFEDGWCFQPLKRSRLEPWFLSSNTDYNEFIVGKVERFFSID